MATVETPSGERTETEQASADALVDELRGIVGPEYVITHEHQLRTYESDGLLHHKVTPVAVVLPDTAEQVQRVVRACYEARVPWVARGAGSGLSGGALPIQDGILIGLARMRKVLEVDLENQRVVVEPSVTNTEISKVVKPSHYFPPDPSSQIVCTIGGNVAENSGGAHCFKYGFTTNYVTGLEIVLPNGEMVELGGKHVDSPGYDLLGPFVGSEGTLGVVTKVTVRVIPSPEAVKTLVAFFENTDDAGQTVSDIVAAGIVPGAIEMMDNLSIQAAEAATKVGYPTDAGAALTVELDGSREECEARFDEVVAVCERNNARDVRVARDESERQLIWKARKSAFAAMGRISPNYFVQDGVIPRTQLAEALRRIAKLSEDYGLGVANVFHAGDGNLHPLIAYDGAVAGEAERAEELSGEIIKICLELGGSITGEHGVGIDKKRYMPKQFSEADLEAFQRLRCSFDPDGLANPGKLMPTPRLCGEVPGPYRQHPLEAAGLAERF
jgi:glycolate oxidase